MNKYVATGSTKGFGGLSEIARPPSLYLLGKSGVKIVHDVVLFVVLSGKCVVNGCVKVRSKGVCTDFVDLLFELRHDRARFRGHWFSIRGFGWLVNLGEPARTVPDDGDPLLAVRVVERFGCVAFPRVHTAEMLRHMADELDLFIERWVLQGQEAVTVHDNVHVCSGNEGLFRE